MYNNYNYPSEADTHDAPWNEKEMPEREFDVQVTTTLTNNFDITTSDYNGYWEDLDPEDGGRYITDTSDTNWDKAYRDIYFTIPEMLKKLKEYVEKDIEALKA